MDKNIARIMIYDEYASCEFSKPTPSSLREKIKQLSWLKWRKKTVEDKEYWKLIIDLSDNKSNLSEFIAMIQKDGFICKVKESKDTDWKDYPLFSDTNDTSERDAVVLGTTGSTKLEKDKKCFFYIQPSYYKALTDLANEKHMTFSQLIICACDLYIRTERAAAPLKALEHQTEEGSFSEKINIEITRRNTKRAWVADKLGISRSHFYSTLISDRWTEEEKKKIRDFFGWKDADA